MQSWINNKLVAIAAKTQDREEGQGVVEYAVVLGVIVVGVVALWNAAPVGAAIDALVDNITTLD